MSKNLWFSNVLEGIGRNQWYEMGQYSLTDI